ncbi:MAG TPA: hypothetical protein V6C81_19840 [Planktothrix sp.]|jgi:hypothetical protein
MPAHQNSENQEQAEEKQPQSQAAPLDYSFGLNGFAYQFTQSNPPTATNSPAVEQTGVLTEEPAATKPVQTSRLAPPVVAEPESMTTETDAWIPSSAQSSRPIEYIETESHGRRPILFSPAFKFQSALFGIFCRVDRDGDKRLSKEELLTAMADGSFRNDEELLVCLLLRMFDNIRRNKTSKTFFDLRGITWDEAINYEGWARYIPEKSFECGFSKSAKPAPVVFERKR